MIYLKLFLEYFKIGLFSIGGGLATLPFLQDLCDKTHWFTMDDLSNLIAVSECTPGPLGVNMATYAGNITAGIPGSIVATLGLVAPSIIIIIIIAQFLNSFKDSKLVQNILYGLRPASSALIAVAMCSVATVALLHLDLFKKTEDILSIFDIKGIILAVLLFIGVKKFKAHPVVYIAIAAICGIVFQF